MLWIWNLKNFPILIEVLCMIFKRMHTRLMKGVPYVGMKTGSSQMSFSLIILILLINMVL